MASGGPLDESFHVSMQNVAIPSGDPENYEITVAEYQFGLLKVKRGDQKTNELNAYLKAVGGQNFDTFRVRKMLAAPRLQLARPPASRRGCVETTVGYTISAVSKLGILFGMRRRPDLRFNADRNGPKRSLIRAFSWHPLRLRCAVALPDDRIYFRDLQFAKWESLVLSHQFQKNINCMEWSPCGSQLAVGCDHGVLIWNFFGSREGAWMTFLPCPDQRLRCVSWSPNGNLLATCGIGLSGFVIWDVSKGHRGSTPFSTPSEVSFLRWSPEGKSLLIGLTSSQKFIVYRTFDFSSISWMNVNYSTAVWSKNGDVLLLAHVSKPIVRVINFSPKVQAFKNQTIIDLTPTLRAPGGIVNQMVWSPDSARLAISFKYRDGKQKGCDLIAVFGTTWKMLPRFQPLGYIRGPPGEKGALNLPVHLKFRPSCEGGALLAVCWTDGQTSLYPMLYETTKRKR